MQKKIIPVCAVATALLIGFLAGYTVFETIPSDSFIISGERETEIMTKVLDIDELGKIDINTASEIELTDLPGVGPAISRRIIEYRETHGPFESVDELINVSGIGEKTLEGLRPYARCEP